MTAYIQGLDALDDAREDSEAAGIEFTSLSLVTFTDGSDQAGLVSREAAIERLQSGPFSYSAQTIGLGTEIDEETLELLGPSGFSFAGDESALAATFAAVGAEVRDLANSFYLVGYVSPKVDGSGSHILTVEAFASGGTASRNYPFDADFFSGGGGFLDVTDLDLPGADASSGVSAQVPDGRLLFAGSIDSQGNGVQASTWLARFDAEGILDPSFANQGRLDIESIGPFDHLEPAGLVAQEGGSGWLLLTARDFDQGSDQRAALLHFGSDGKVINAIALDPVTPEAEQARDLARSAGGNLLLLSQVGIDPISRTLVRQLDPTSLSPDPAFGAGGAVLLAADASVGQERPVALALDAMGRIFLVGGAFSTAQEGRDMAVTALLPTGAIDVSFGEGGRVFQQQAFGSSLVATAHALSIDQAGRIVVAGEVFGPQASSTAAWWRMDANGSPDLTFTGNASNPFLGSGLVVLGGDLVSSPSVLFGASSSALALSLLPDGSILSAGQRGNARGDQDLCYWSLSVAGVFRQAFNATGFLIEDGTGGQGSDESLQALRIHPSGRIFALGSTRLPQDPEADRRAILWQDREPDRIFAPLEAN